MEKMLCTKEKIEKLRKELEKMISEADDLNIDNILYVSRKLDKAIIKFIKDENTVNTYGNKK